MPSSAVCASAGVNSLPEASCSLILESSLRTASSEISRAITFCGSIFKSLNSWIYLRLKGQPSRIQPFKRQSGLLSLSLTRSITTSSGTIKTGEVVSTAHTYYLEATIHHQLTDAILSDVALELASVVVIVVAPCHFFDQLGDLNVDNLVLLSDAECVLFLLRTWGAHQDNPLGSSGSVRVIQLQNAVDLFNDSHLRLIALKLRDETLANVLDSLQLTNTTQRLA